MKSIMISGGGSDKVVVDSTSIGCESATCKIGLNDDAVASITEENRFNGQEFACSVSAANTSPIMAMLADDPTVKQVCAPVLTPVGSTMNRRTSGNSVTMPHPPDIGISKGGIGATCNKEKEKIENFLEYASKTRLDAPISKDDLGVGAESRTSSGSFHDVGVFDLEDS